MKKSQPSFPLTDIDGRRFELWTLDDCECSHCRIEFHFKRYEDDGIVLLLPGCDDCESSFLEKWLAYSDSPPYFRVQGMTRDGRFFVREPRLSPPSIN